MKLQLTNKGDGKQLIVDVDALKLIEPFGEGGTHIVFGPDMGRVVAEDFASIVAVVGAVVPKSLINE